MSDKRTFDMCAKNGAQKLVALIHEVAAREKKTVAYVVECIEVVGVEYFIPNHENKGEPGFSLQDMQRAVVREAKQILGIGDHTN